MSSYRTHNIQTIIRHLHLLIKSKSCTALEAIEVKDLTRWWCMIGFNRTSKMRTARSILERELDLHLLIHCLQKIIKASPKVIRVWGYSMTWAAIKVTISIQPLLIHKISVKWLLMEVQVISAATSTSLMEDSISISSTRVIFRIHTF